MGRTRATRILAPYGPKKQPFIYYIFDDRLIVRGRFFIGSPHVVHDYLSRVFVKAAASNPLGTAITLIPNSRTIIVNIRPPTVIGIASP